MTNHAIAKIFYEIAAYLDMDAVPFKPRAYEKVAQAVEAYERDMADVYKEGGIKALEEIPGVGTSIAEKIEELIKTGKLAYYEKLKKKIPVDVSGLIAIESVGPKHIKVFWEKLRVKNLADLEKAARTGKIRKLPHFGIKSEEKILKAIEVSKSRSGRSSIFAVLPVARGIEAMLKKLPQVSKIAIAGSLRRRKETIGDIDILVVSDEPKAVMDAFTSAKNVSQILAHGETKSAIILDSGIDADLRVVPAKSFGAALNYFTGSKAHNVALRQLAIKKGWKLSEYGLFDKHGKQIAGETEDNLYKKLGLQYIPPEMREAEGEIEMAAKHAIPTLIERSDIRGDLQIQTNWTDGKHSIEEMAKEAKKQGLAYIVITDHTKNLAMTGGQDEKGILKQMAYIEKLNHKSQITNHKFCILKGAEVDILKDGSLDIADKVLAKLDVVGVSVHTYFNLSKEEQTKRIIKAMENPHADILFHPTGRIVGQREPYDVDIDAIIAAAKRTGTVLEINSSYRLDLKDEYIRKVLKAGVKLAINTDAHAKEHFAWLEYGVHNAKRGWVTKKDVVNAMSLKELLAFFTKSKKSRF
ncbi:MAG: DNA polymerase/3'-5' exonuclease PolX [bacterium]|nr:DNA polymerase/3'-5' exonuclease PolX [bacterium]